MHIPLLMRTKDNAVSVLEALIHFFHVKVSSTTIENTLKSHPDYPSLLAVSDGLREWKINHQAAKLDQSEFSEDYFPIIAHLKSEGGKFIFLKSASIYHFTYDDENGKNQKISRDDFQKQWSGIVLQTDIDAQSGEINYVQNRTKERIQLLKTPLLICSLFLLLFFFLSNQTIENPFYFFPLLFVKIIGLTVSSLLLIQSVDANNPFVKNLCSLSKKNHCNAILKSDAAKLNSWLSWSELGFAYFSITLLVHLMGINQHPIVWSLFIASLLCIPYSIYSIYYQSKIVKNWCVLCCIIQASFWLEVIFSLPIINVMAFTLSQFTTLFHWYYLFAFVPVLLWSFSKDFFQKAMQLATVKQQLKQFKFNSELFQSLLHTQSHHVVVDALMPVKLGNLEAKTIITMVSNPFCGPCVHAHSILDTWLQHRDDIMIQIIFTGTTMDKESRLKIRKHLIALGEHTDAKYMEETLNSWYALSTKKYEDWELKDTLIIDEEKVQLAMELQEQWCEQAAIEFTPTILINGYKMPEQYRLEDIQYLI